MVDKFAELIFNCQQELIIFVSPKINQFRLVVKTRQNLPACRFGENDQNLVG